MKKGEVWIQIENFPAYAVSDAGSVMRISSGRILKKLVHRGYSRVHLYKDGVQYERRVARLVALHHIPNPENKAQVNHRCGEQTTNDAVSNLEWVTRSENVAHAYRTGLKFPHGIDLVPLYDAVRELAVGI
jgi:hypothetical protein